MNHNLVTCKFHNLFGGKYCQVSHTHTANSCGAVSFYTETNISEDSAVQDNKGECQTTLILLTHGLWLRKTRMRDSRVSYQRLSTTSCLTEAMKMNSDQLLLNRKDTNLLWGQHTGQMADVSEWRSALRSEHSVSEWAKATQWCSYIPWAIWCETAKRTETMITFIRHFPLLLSHPFSPFIRFYLHLNHKWAFEEAAVTSDLSV